VGRGVVDRRGAVPLLERGGDLFASQPVHLDEDRLRGGGVDLLEGPFAEDLVAAEDLEEVELDVTEVALVVAHGPTFETRFTGYAGPGPERSYSSVT